jgi:mono/diheme cytochrome c family protein
MYVSNFSKAVTAVSLIAAGALIYTLASDVTVEAQAGGAAPQGQTAAPQGRGAAPAAEAPYAGMPVDKYDRNATLWEHERSGYKQGWQRGRELFFMNCWMCHSEYVIAADFLPVPSLKDVAKRMTDAQITAYIQNGIGRMPAFKQLTDADIRDLLTLFKEKCGLSPTGSACFDEHNPPPNPLYRFGTDYLAPHAVDAVKR